MLNRYNATNRINGGFNGFSDRKNNLLKMHSKIECLRDGFNNLEDNNYSIKSSKAWNIHDAVYQYANLNNSESNECRLRYLELTNNIPIDRNDKKDTKLIVYSSDLSKIYDTKGIHAYTGTAIISIGYKDKSGGSFSYTNKVSLRDITDHIVNVVSDNEYPFKTNEEISLKAIYKQEKGSKRYKEVLWGYMVIKTIEYNELSKKQPREAVALKDQKGKEIAFKISDIIKKDDLDKLKQGGHTIVFFAYLEGESDKFKYQSVYGKNHIRIDIKIPLYIKFKDDKLIIYEFEHAIKEKSFKASLNHDDALVNKSGYLYINKDMSAQDINIYEDDKLTKELKSEEKTNKRYQIYIDEANSANNQNPSNTNQAGQTKINQDTKYGINLLSKDNMNSFINSFNESKSITRVDKGMWVDGDKGVGVDLNNKTYNILIEGTMETSKIGNELLLLMENEDTILSITMVAGGFGSGAPQNGEYTVDTYRNRRKDKDYNPGMNILGVGFSFNLNPQFETERSLLRIHPDGNNKGTLGCIGVTGTKEELLKFEETMKNILKQQKSIGATINIKNNPNNSTSPKKITVRE